MDANCPQCGDLFDVVGPDGEKCYRCSLFFPRSDPGPEFSPYGRGAKTVRVADVKREEVDWLWAERLPLGRLTGIIGDPGAGKSWLTLALATAVTTGAALPSDSERPAGDVLLLTAEDGLADTVRPRLEDMGADLERVTVLTAVRDAEGAEHHPSLVDDLPVLADLLAVGRYTLLIIDPINAYLGSSLDTHRDAALRSVLAPLANLAEQWGVAVIFVGHLNKGSRDRAIYRANGSVAYIGASRVVHLVGQNPENEERAIVCIKNNLATTPSALGFELREGQFYWLGESAITAATLLSPDASEDERSTRQEAMDFLRDLLQEGPVEAQAVQNQARDCGITVKILRTARETLGIKSSRVGGMGAKGKWVWSLPNMPKMPNPSTTEGHLSENGHLKGLAKYAVEELGLKEVGHD
jgi:putative DNA primase/helicase